MKIVLPLPGSPSLEIAENAEAKQVAAALAAHPDVTALAKEAGRSSGYQPFETGDMDDMTARRIAKMYCSDGQDAAEDLIYDLGLRESEESYFENVVQKDFERDLHKLAAEIVEELTELDPEEIVDEVVELLKETVTEAMTGAGKSGPLDVIPSHLKVEVAFAMGYGGGAGIDDIHTESIDQVSGPGTLIPNVSFLRLLKLLNVSVAEYVAMVKEEGYDLIGGEVDEKASDYRKEQQAANALQWRAVLGAETGDLKAIGELPLRGKYEIAEWNSRVDLIRSLKDYSRPQALTRDNLMTVLTEATYGGVPTFVARLPLKALIEGAYGQPFLATGGFVGLHHFGNGSGYIERPDAPVLIDPVSAGAFFVQRTSKDTIDDVYGIVPSYYSLKTADPHRTRWRQTIDGSWRIEGPKTDDGEDTFYAVVTAEEAKAGVKQYQVQTHSYEDGCPAGPLETGEVFKTLDDARYAGEDALKDVQLSAAPRP